MRRCSILVALLLVQAVLYGEEAQAPRRSRRIIVYDQQPSLVTPQASVQAIPEREAERRLRLDREISQSGLNDPMDTALPQMTSLTPLTPSIMVRQETEEEEDVITAEDFLGEEDLLDMEISEASEETPEMEITDWETLQQQLIKDEMTGTTEEQARLEEEQLEEELLAQRLEGRDGGQTSGEEAGLSGGLNLESALGSSGDPTVQRTGGDELAPSSVQMASDPVLQPIRFAGDADVPVIGTPITPESVEFTGSRKLLEGIQERAETRAPTSSLPSSRPAPPVAKRFSSPPPASFPGQSAGGVRGFGSASAPQPALPLPLNPVVVTRPEAPRQQPPPPVRREPQTRIRSQLGVGAGPGF